jgi:plasmid stabilization system protein ParE
MSGYAFHPDAFADLDEIWEYIAEDNIDVADRVLADPRRPPHRGRLTTHRTPTS